MTDDTLVLRRRALGLLSALAVTFSLLIGPVAAAPIHAAQAAPAPTTRSAAADEAPTLSRAVPPTRTAALMAPPGDGRGLRVKDIAQFQGARDNQLTGIGLVIGLNGTGDSPTATFTYKELANMLERLGLNGLAGTIPTRRHGRVAFAFIVNAPNADADVIYEEEDRALDALATM